MRKATLLPFWLVMSCRLVYVPTSLKEGFSPNICWLGCTWSGQLNWVSLPVCCDHNRPTQIRQSVTLTFTYIDLFMPNMKKIFELFYMISVADAHLFKEKKKSLDYSDVLVGIGVTRLVYLWTEMNLIYTIKPCIIEASAYFTEKHKQPYLSVHISTWTQGIHTHLNTTKKLI